MRAEYAVQDAEARIQEVAEIAFLIRGDLYGGAYDYSERAYRKASARATRLQNLARASGMRAAEVQRLLAA